MKILLIEALKIVVCSGVLWGTYELLLDRRAPLHWCRRYLLLLPVLAGLIPLLRIPLLPAPAIELEPFDAALLIDGAPAPAAVRSAPFPLAETIIIAVWAAGLLVLAGAMLGQARIIRRLRRDAAIFPAGRFRLALTRRKIAPFSFCGTIYLWEETPADERHAIIAHETSHLARHHSAERILMECMKALLWWNPFVWLAARRLAEAEEYEADHDVLTQGYDPRKYMDTLFRQLFGYSPDMANGLRNSFTKKRFQMMMNYHFGRYALLRLAGVIPVITGLMCAFSLTTRAAEVRTTTSAVRKPTTAETAPGEKPEPIYMLNGAEISKEELFAPDGRFHKQIETMKNASDDEESAFIQLHSLPVEEAVRKYGEKGRNGIIEVTCGRKPATTEPARPAQNPPATGNDEALGEEQPFLVAETMPQFQGGDLSSFRLWVMQRVRYPQEAMNRGIEGRVVLSFIIERDGSMGPVNVVQSPDRLLTDEALRILGTVPAGAWTPGMQNGRPVRVRYMIPVDFRIIPAQETAPAENEPLLIAETMPQFQGGDLQDFRAWVQGRLSYPEEAKKQGIQGRVVVTFVIEGDGSMGPINVLASPDQLLTDEALRIFGSVPAGAWAPGRDNSGEAVRVKYTMPVDFRLDPAETPATAPNE